MKQIIKPRKMWLGRCIHRGDIVVKSYTYLTLSRSGIVEGDVYVEENAHFNMKGVMNGTIYNKGVVEISGLLLGCIKENRCTN
ncbi:hypothetical protein [Acinetobacter gerneri]|jgi:cytoskeletal protein CcmA (bactofilin family)|uniref:hypothetical protein n=1 Tax=Acinetobacter gerneri TaxID=202952 RepID=UPI0023F26D07|nr:hypothetical protein [Acinetobacter gerneri]MCH4245932.1 hypothetical protein [Acinetobacter gerneri]